MHILRFQVCILAFQTSILKFQMHILEFQIYILKFQMHILEFQIHILKPQMHILEFWMCILKFQVWILNFQMRIYRRVFNENGVFDLPLCSLSIEYPSLHFTPFRVPLAFPWVRRRLVALEEGSKMVSLVPRRRSPSAGNRVFPPSKTRVHALEPPNLGSSAEFDHPHVPEEPSYPTCRSHPSSSCSFVLQTAHLSRAPVSGSRTAGASVPLVTCASQVPLSPPIHGSAPSRLFDKSRGCRLEFMSCRSQMW